MRRIGRWMLNGVTALSLLLCLATIALWARSYWRRDVGPILPGMGVRAVTSRGGISIMSEAFTQEVHVSYPYYVHVDRLRGPVRFWKFAGFSYLRQDLYSGSGMLRIWVAPIALFTFMTGLLPAIRLKRMLSRRRRGPGFCAVCRYDLTGNQSGICPECGTAIARA